MGNDVRHGTLEDVGWILKELKKFSEFQDVSYKLFGGVSEEILTDYIKNHLVLVTENKTGFIVGLVFDHYLNPDIRVLSEVAWWVKEESRKSKAGLLLLNEFTTWGEANCDWITMALESNSPVNDKHLLKRNYKKIETNYLREVR